MMKGWPGLTVVTLFILLAFTASASAECAWVLWEGELLEGSWEWLIFGTYLTARDCGVGLAEDVRVRRKLGYKVTEPVSMAASYKFSRQGENVRGELHCLPDTVDPRGPKGK